MAHNSNDIQSPGGLDSTMIALVGGISVLIFVVLVIATETWFYNQDRLVHEQTWTVGNAEMQQYHATQNQWLNGLNNVPGKDEKVAVPIDFAIERYAAGLKETQPR